MRILFSTRKPHVPLGQGGGEVIAHDLLSQLHSTGAAEVRAFGAFNYRDVEPMGRQLGFAGTRMRLDQQVETFRSTGSPDIHYPAYAHMLYQMPGAHEVVLAREDHYIDSLAHCLAQFKPEVHIVQAQGAAQAVELFGHGPARMFLFVQTGLEIEEFQRFGVPLPECLASSKYLARSLFEKHGKSSHVLYPAIAVDRYRTAHLPPVPRTAFTILFINPHPLKGLHVLLELAARLKDVRFLVLEGWEPIGDALRARLGALGNVTCISKTWDMSRIYHMADLLIVPSQWEEIFGRVVVEAQAAGLPVLASHVAGLPEAVGDAGFLVEDFKNPAAWQEAIEHLIANPALFAACKGNMEANVQKFTAAVAAAELLKIMAKPGV